MENGDKPITSVLLRQIGKDKFRIASEKDSREGQFLSSELGLTKREYFASQAMNSLASNEEWAKTMKIADDWDEYIKRLTEGAVDMADALLTNLEKSKPC